MIVCATLSLVGEGKGEEVRRQAELFHARVSGPKAMHVFKAAEGADAQCQVGNLPLASGAVLAWLEVVDRGNRA